MGRLGLRILWALLGVVLASTSCARKSTAPARPIRIAMLHFLSNAPLALADAGGDFRREGLQVEMVRVDSTASVTPALLRGDVDVVPGLLLIAHLNAMSKGASVRVVADKGHFEPGCAATAIVLRRGFADGKDPEDPAVLRKARVASVPLSYSEYLLDRLLGKKGLRLADLDATNLTESVAAEAFLSGAIDLATLSEPNLSRVVSSGKAFVWKNGQDVVPGGQLSYLMYGARLLADREAGRRFLKAYLSGVRRYHEGKTASNLDALARFTGVQRERLEKACWQPVRPDGRINEESLLDFQRWAVERGELGVTVPLDKVWDPWFVDQAGRTP